MTSPRPFTELLSSRASRAEIATMVQTVRGLRTLRIQYLLAVADELGLDVEVDGLLMTHAEAAAWHEAQSAFPLRAAPAVPGPVFSQAEIIAMRSGETTLQGVGLAEVEVERT